MRVDRPTFFLTFESRLSVALVLSFGRQTDSFLFSSILPTRKNNAKKVAREISLSLNTSRISFMLNCPKRFEINSNPICTPLRMDIFEWFVFDTKPEVSLGARHAQGHAFFLTCFCLFMHRNNRLNVGSKT